MTLQEPQLPEDNQTFVKRQPRISLTRAASFLLLPLAAGAAIFFLIRDSSQLLTQSIDLNPLLAGLSFLVSGLGLLVAITIWRRILARFGVSEAFREDIRIYNYSALGLALPGGIWAIVSRAGLYGKLGVKSLPVVTASVVESFVIGIAGLGVYAILALLQPALSLWNRPEFVIGFALLALVMIQPKVFNWIINRVLQKSKRNEVPLNFDFPLWELLLWIGVEMVVITIGGLAVFVLLASLTPAPADSLIPVIAAWAAAVATGNLFFWLPGSPLLRDGAMVLALTISLPLPLALVFVLLVRIWSIVSLLLAAGLAWLALDLPFRGKAQIIRN